jgi:hypothetical protein
MAVPEAPVDKYHFTMTDKDDIWLPRKIGDMESKSIAQAM